MILSKLHEDNFLDFLMWILRARENIRRSKNKISFVRNVKATEKQKSPDTLVFFGLEKHWWSAHEFSTRTFRFIFNVLGGSLSYQLGARPSTLERTSFLAIHIVDSKPISMCVWHIFSPWWCFLRGVELWYAWRIEYTYSFLTHWKQLFYKFLCIIHIKT